MLAAKAEERRQVAELARLQALGYSCKEEEDAVLEAERKARQEKEEQLAAMARSLKVRKASLLASQALASRSHLHHQLPNEFGPRPHHSNEDGEHLPAAKRRRRRSGKYEKEDPSDPTRPLSTIHSPAKVAQAIEYKHQGLPVKEISEKLGISSNSLYFIFRRVRARGGDESDSDVELPGIVWTPLYGYHETESEE